VKDDVYVSLMPITLNSLKDRIETATARTGQPLLQNVWHRVGYHLMCAGQQMEHILKLTEGMKNFSSCSFP
jgi:hypothetical protein